MRALILIAGLCLLGAVALAHQLTPGNEIVTGTLRIPNGSSPAATCSVGELFLDTDETVDTNCTTVADNSICVCAPADTWTSKT